MTGLSAKRFFSFAIVTGFLAANFCSNFHRPKYFGGVNHMTSGAQIHCLHINCTATLAKKESMGFHLIVCY